MSAFQRLFLITVFWPVCLTPVTAADRPNILFVYLDDFGWRDTGFMGSDFYETPNLDRLAAEGLIFTHAYSAAANCAPARASLLSGQYTPRHQIYNVGTRARGKAQHRRLRHIPGTDVLDPGITTWAQQLQSAGYATASIGKWHLSEDPVPYGFDLNIGGTRSGSPPGGYYPPHRRAPGLQDAPSDEYLTDRLTDEAIKFIRQQSAAPSGKPWAVYLSHFAVHTPLDAKRQLLEKYSRKKPGQLHSHVPMATMIQAVDDGVGKLQAALEELGQQDNTVLIFFSDNGGYGPATDMHPLKGYKGTYYEGGIRVPCFIRWPKVIPAGGRSSEPIIAVDLYPTLCEIAGVAVPDDQAVDGISLMPLLNGSQTTLGERPLFWHFPAYLESYAVMDEQRDPLFRSRPCSIVRQGPWKLHQYFEDQGLELYNLQEDPGETQNLAHSQPEKTKAMLQTLQEWQASVQAAIPSEPNPDYDAAAEAQAMAARRNRK